LKSSIIQTYKRRLALFAVSLAFAALITTLLIGCEDLYGKVGGADETIPADIVETIEPWRGVWYSHYGGRKLDSYRVGLWKERHGLLPQAKRDLFPDFDIDHPKFRGLDADIKENDYFIFYDDTVYETIPGDGGNGGWGDSRVFRYIGIVRAVNVFQESGSGAGAVIIEYLDGCCPTWDRNIYQTPLPFFGVYYRILNHNCIQMANAVELANLAAGKPYYTETATLDEAIAKNNAENDSEFISWGIVIPQDRE
jgi:hypothetical protein